MTEFGKVLTATGLSVLAHVSLFTVLALTPGRSVVPIVEEQPEKTLQVTIETATAIDAAPVHFTKENAIRTQIDPPNLKKAEKAPENPTEVAAYNSQATPPKPATVPDSFPSPTPVADEKTLALEMQAASTPKSESAEEVGIDALGAYGKAIGNAIGNSIGSDALPQKSRKEFLAVGEVRIQFSLDAKGQVSEIKILSNSAGPTNAECAIRAVKAAKIPPIPPERLAQVPSGRMKIVYTFITY